MTPEEAAQKFGTLVGTFGTTWSPRTNLRKPRPAEPKADEAHEHWTYTRALILRTLHRFPDALGAIRQALADLRRRCPKELHEPG